MGRKTEAIPLDEIRNYIDYYEAFARDYYRKNYHREPTEEEIIRYIADLYAGHMYLDYDVAVRKVREIYQRNH